MKESSSSGAGTGEEGMINGRFVALHFDQVREERTESIAM
jgi:hypothetical protein